LGYIWGYFNYEKVLILQVAKSGKDADEG